MRFSWLAVYALVLVGVCGCGGTSNSLTSPTPQTAQFGIVSGNWGFSMLSFGSPAIGAEGGGNLVQNGTNISGILHLSGSPCFDPLTDDLFVSGTATGSTTAFDGVITFKTAPVRGQTITFTSGTLPPPIPGLNELMVGSFTLDGGTCAPGMHGSMSGVMVPTVTGTWKGAFTPFLAGATPLAATANLTQSGPDAHGFFQISGNLAFSGSKCFTAGTITSGSVLGMNATLTIATNDGGQVSFSPQLPGRATSSGMEGLYAIQTGACSFDGGDGLLNKQP
jgi:hypothetical protein